MIDRCDFELRRSCPLCTAAERDDHLVLDGFHIDRCRTCGFLYVVEVIPDALSKRYYEAGYAGLRHRQGQAVNASVNVAVLGRIGDLKGRSLCDIGSGFAFLPARARDVLGMTVTAVELSDAERLYAVESHGVETFASLDDIPRDRTFDVVSLFEVIEHIREPHAFLQQAPCW